ncbi:MAG: hypothetical protein ABI793_14905 [Flavobacterium sp.]
MKKTIIFLIVLIIISCNDTKKKNNKVVHLPNPETENFSLSDSLFIGEPLAGDPFFIKNTTEGGFSYVDEYDTILNRHNDVFSHFKSDEIIKSIQVTVDLSFELKRIKYKRQENLKNIQIMFYTKFKGIVKDSILFYKYQIDKDGERYIQQRFETLSYIDEKLNLYNLNTYTSLSEIAVAVDSWEKYVIEKKSGKIKLINKMNYSEIVQREQDKMDKSTVINENPENPSSSQIFDYDFENMTFHYDCNVSDFVNFSLNDGDFSCPSNGIRFEASLIKKDENNFELKYSEIKGYEIESSLDSKNYSKEIPIGKIKYSDNKIEFTWLGFYNTKTKKREFVENPFTGKVENSSIILKKCQE